jgi:aminoglycoside 6'-N-acetyltransferase I
MRRVLWEDCLDEQQVRAMEEILVSDSEEVFVAERTGGGQCGFVEVAVRPWAIGCLARPIGYIEGWFVDENARRQAIGRALVGAAENWARSKGCRQMASDADLGNTVSHQAHGALGYEETTRLGRISSDRDRTTWKSRATRSDMPRARSDPPSPRSRAPTPSDFSTPIGGRARRRPCGA